MSDYKWKTAIYLRYSDKEDGKSESGSIDTQRSMLQSMRMMIIRGLILIVLASNT